MSMTNSSKLKQMNSKHFYGSSNRTNPSISKKDRPKYLSSVDRQVLREKREVLKALIENSPAKIPPAPIVPSSPRCCDSSSTVGEENTRIKQQREKLFPIFYSQSSPSVSPSGKSNRKSPETIQVAAVSPQALRISLPGTPKTRGCVPFRESPKRQQAIIDAGQKTIGASQCSLCGMVYTANLPHDQHEHAVYHQRFLDSVKFSGWKNERVLLRYTRGRILKILPTDPKYALKKVKDICAVIDADLGFANQVHFSYSPLKIVYLYVSDNRQVAGCLVAEPINHAFRLLTSSVEKHAISTCSRFSEPAECGVSRIWTYYPYRRQGIASRLVDALRNTFVLGAQLKRNQIAFSDPTSDGIKFASHYCQTKEFLTYNLTHQ